MVQSMVQSIVKFADDENGATSIEYALIALLISTVILVSVRSVGTTLVNIFTMVGNGFSK
jgi:pilus assembly protein Flp/PilA